MQTPDWEKTARLLTKDKDVSWEAYLEGVAKENTPHRALRLARGGGRLFRLSLLAARLVLRGFVVLRGRRVAQSGELGQEQPSSSRL